MEMWWWETVARAQLPSDNVLSLYTKSNTKKRRVRACYVRQPCGAMCAMCHTVQTRLTSTTALEKVGCFSISDAVLKKMERE
jgi:hypothetical protein